MKLKNLKGSADFSLYLGGRDFETVETLMGALLEDIKKGKLPDDYIIAADAWMLVRCGEEIIVCKVFGQLEIDEWKPKNETGRKKTKAKRAEG